MDSISFTTFLKLCLLNSTTAKANELQRLHNRSSGYDFYKRLKMSASAVASGQKAPDQIIAEIQEINRPAERDHNLYVAQQFLIWWNSLHGAYVHEQPPKGTFRLPWMSFNIRLSPELRYIKDGVDTITYLWATALPKLSPQIAATGLMILRSAFAYSIPASTRLEIRDLRANRTFDESVLSNMSSATMAAELAMVNSLWEHIQPKDT